MPITVRRASVHDAAAYARIMGDPGVYPGLMQMPYTNEELWSARLTESSAPGKTDLLLVAELDGALMAALCGYADSWVGALRLELSVYTDNRRAIGLYQKFGFVIEGTMRGYAMREGQFADTHAMARFHPNPPRIAVPPL